MDWRSLPVAEVEYLIDKFSKVPYMVTDYEAGKLIHWARPIEEDEEINTIEGLSYKPQDLNHKYQREHVFVDNLIIIQRNLNITIGQISN